MALRGGKKMIDEMIVNIYDGGCAFSVTILDNERCFYHEKDESELAIMLADAYDLCSKEARYWQTHKLFSLYLEKVFGKAYKRIIVTENSGYVYVNGHHVSGESEWVP